MYVGPWQEFKAMERARIAEQHASMAQMAQRRGQPPADQNMADELERLRRALELVSGELPPEAAHKVRRPRAPRDANERRTGVVRSARRSRPCPRRTRARGGPRGTPAACPRRRPCPRGTRSGRRRRCTRYAAARALPRKTPPRS